MGQGEQASGKGFTATLGYVLAAAMFVNVAFRGGSILKDPDTWWHVRSGQLMLSQGDVIRTDPFSYTYLGQPWIVKEWVSELILALTYNLGGWGGLLLLTALVMSLTTFLFYRSAARTLQPIYAGVVTLCATYFAQGALVPRPHILTFLLAVIFVPLMFGAARRLMAPSFWTLLITWIWGNMHGSFPLAFMISGCAFLDYVERSRLSDRKTLLRWLVYLALTALVPLANPFFLKTYEIALGMAQGNTSMGIILEWRPFSFTEDKVAAGALFVAFAILLKVRARFTLGQILFTLLAVYMMLSHIRFLYVFFLLVPLVLLPDIATAVPAVSWQSWANRQRDGLEAFADRRSTAILAAIVAVLAGYSALLMQPGRIVPPEQVSISGAIDYVKQHQATSPALQKHVMNEYNFGGPLIMAGIPTYVDGRSEQIFLGKFIDDYIESSYKGGTAKLMRLLEDPRIGWVLVAPGDARDTALSTQPGWKKTYADDAAVIYERQG